MIDKDGYFPPRDKVFEEIKKACIKTWTTLFTDEYGYVSEKIEMINHFKNEGADVMHMLNMFHPGLRDIVIRGLSGESRDYIKYYDKVNENQRSDTEENHR